MRITKISSDNAGYKLIAAETVFVCSPKAAIGKTVSISHTLFDYKDGILREFRHNRTVDHQAATFKDALKIVLRMGDVGYNCAYNTLKTYGHIHSARMKLVS